MSWGHFSPAWVVRGMGLTRFNGGRSVGKHIAALKCYLAIASLVVFKTKTADISITAFETMTGCSRPMVILGIRVLNENSLVLIDRTRHTHRYTLTGFDRTEKDPFSKVPQLVRAVLSQLPNRGESALSAIKLLVLFLALRNTKSGSAKISHERIRDYSSLQAKRIRQGIDHLVNHGLIHVGEEESTYAGHPINVYTMRGDFLGGRRSGAQELPTQSD